LLVRSREAKFWLFRYKLKGRRMREMGLGPAIGPGAISLSEAREKAAELHKKVREGRDPLDERDAEAAKAKVNAAKAAAAAITFRACAEKYIAVRSAGWRNAKHAAQWPQSLEDYAYPVIGDLPVGAVETGHVTQILEPMWATKTETASRVRGRIESVLDFAKTHGWRSGENPARWKGHIENILPRKNKVARVEHHHALPWREMGTFMQKLRATTSVAARCLEFAILTATRSGEARGARWSEIDLVQRIWTIPAERMKAEREHRVPLPDAALGVLEEMAKARLFNSPDSFVFPGGRAGGQTSHSAIWRGAMAVGGDAVTVHGFRSTFRDWAGETTAFPREVIEMALAHRLGDKAEQAYARGDLFQKRHRLMDEWAEFCSRPMPAEGGNVVGLRGAAA
jgi:integrase